MKTLRHLLNFRDQSKPYTCWPHYGPLKVERTVHPPTAPPSFDHWAHELRLPLKYSTAAR